MELEVMREARVLIGVVSLILVVLGVRISAAQIDSRMPEGPNRALVARLCTTCHDLGHLVSTGGRSPRGRGRKILEKQAHGAGGTAGGRGPLFAYLAASPAP